MSVTHTSWISLIVRAIRQRRWAVVALLSLLLHAAALQWAGNNFRLPVVQQESPPPVILQTALVQPAPAKPALPARPQPKPRRPKPAPKPATPATDHPATATPATSTIAVPQQSTAIASPPVGAVSPFDGPDIASIEFPAAEPAAAAPEPGVARYKVDPPPSAELKYDVMALREGQKVYGHGTIGWHFNGQHYTINGDAGILFISALSFTSQGYTNDFGIAPTLYTEKRFRRAATTTHFDHARQLISFSASAKSYPLQGGEQDRASIIWQLAGIGRGDSARFSENAQISLFIAGARDGETWQIQVMGEEEIATGIGQLQAWHLRRIARAGSHDQQLDIWLAPGQQWYPVRLRFTEVNGEYLDMSLSAIHPALTR